MCKFVRLDNGRVVERLIADALPEYHPSLVWAEVPEGIDMPQEGWIYADGAYAPPPVDLVALAAGVRAQRDARLTVCDWTQMPDAPLSIEAKAAWAAYRQQLRDVPEQAGFPLLVAWPEGPE